MNKESARHNDDYEYLTEEELAQLSLEYWEAPPEWRAYLKASFPELWDDDIDF